MDIEKFLKRYEKIILIILLLAASFIRLYDLGNLPSGFHNDEASFFLNAQALKATLRDEDNQLLPIYLNSYIDPKPALYSYIQIPFITIFGESYTASRLPAALFGIISIFLLYVLLKKLISIPIALIATYVIVLSPWHIMLSRATQEVIMSFTFMLASILMLIITLQRKKKQLFPSILFLLFTLLSMYTYHSAKIYLPILCGLVLMYFLVSKQTSKKYFISLFICLGVVTAITIFAGGFARYDAVGIFNYPAVQLVIDERIRTATGHTDPLFIRVFTNKLIGYSHEIIKHYGQYFSVTFLFTDGGQPSRYLVPFHGLLYIFEALLLLVGIGYGMVKENYRKIIYFFLAWLFIVPLPSALTVGEIPSVIRTFPMIVPLIVFISLGIYGTITHKFKTIYFFLPTIFLGIMYLWGFNYFWFQLTVQQPNYHPWYRNYGAQQLPKAVEAMADNYDQIIVTTNQYVYFALDDVISIKDLQKSYPQRLQDKVTFGKITFISNNCSISQIDRDVLYVLTLECEKFISKEYKKVKQISFNDGSAEYVFYEKRMSNSDKNE